MFKEIDVFTHIKDVYQLNSVVELRRTIEPNTKVNT
jgi:hypothetical protein